jgi:hypothetical protein
MPVKLSDELVKQARDEAKAADRSITAQIEHWAKLGRQVENVLRHEDTLALKRSAANDSPPTRASVEAVLRSVAGGVSKEISRALTAGRTVYQADPNGSDAVERIEPDGHRAVGRFQNRRFVEQKPSPRRR